MCPVLGPFPAAEPTLLKQSGPYRITSRQALRGEGGTGPSSLIPPRSKAREFRHNLWCRSLRSNALPDVTCSSSAKPHSSASAPPSPGRALLRRGHLALTTAHLAEVTPCTEQDLGLGRRGRSSPTGGSTPQAHGQPSPSEKSEPGENFRGSQAALLSGLEGAPRRTFTGAGGCGLRDRRLGSTLGGAKSAWRTSDFCGRNLQYFQRSPWAT